MPNFTGILGSMNAQPGTLVPGAGPSATSGLTVSDSITVTPTITFDVIQGKWKRLTDSITVTPTVIPTRILPRTFTDSITVTPTVTETAFPISRITQFIPEVVYTWTPTAYLSQFVVEVVYKKATSVTVVHNITVISTPDAIDRVVHETVSHAISVTSTATGRDNLNRQTVSHAITVTPALTEHDNVTHETVTHSITVAQTIGLPDRNVRQTVAQTVTVTPSITERSTIVHETIAHSISVTPTLSGRQNVIPITVIDHIAVTSTPSARNTNVRITVVTSIAVSGPSTGDSSHQFVTDNMDVNDDFTFRNTNDRVFLRSTIVVSQAINFRNTVNRQTIVDNIQIPQNLPNAWPARGRDDHVRITVTQPITVTTAIFGGPNPRRISVSDHVTVGQSVRTGWQFQTVIQHISVDSKVGGVARAITVADAIAVSDSFTFRNDVIRQIVTDSVLITTTRIGQTPRVPESVADSIIVFFTLTSRVIPGMLTVTDNITVTPTISVGGNRRQTVHDTITVTPTFRDRNNRQTVADNIAVTTRFPTVWLTVHDRITVSQKAYQVFNASITDTLPLSESTTQNTSRNRSIVQELSIEDTVQRGVIWTRSIVDTLIFPEVDFQRKYSFWPYPFTIPVVSGGLMANLVVLRSGSDSITLPAAMLGDTQGGTDKITVQRSMNAKTMTIVQSNDRRKLKLKFRVSLKKSLELRKFVMSNIAGLIQLTDWNGAQWVGRFMSNPFAFEHTGRSVTEQEFVTFEIDFEGAKISG